LAVAMRVAPKRHRMAGTRARRGRLVLLPIRRRSSALPRRS